MKNYSVVVLFDKVSASFSLPMVVEDNTPLLRRELKNQIQSGKSYELSVNFRDKVCFCIGAYSIDNGLLDGVAEPIKLFDLKDLFEESEESR